MEGKTGRNTVGRLLLPGCLWALSSWPSWPRPQPGPPAPSEHGEQSGAQRCAWRRELTLVFIHSSSMRAIVGAEYSDPSK